MSCAGVWITSCAAGTVANAEVSQHESAADPATTVPQRETRRAPGPNAEQLVKVADRAKEQPLSSRKLPESLPAMSAPEAVVGGSSVPAIGVSLGSADPVLVDRVAADGSWLSICQARADTDNNGVTRVTLGPHGEFQGDELKRYLIRKVGPGETIDAFVDATPDGRFISYIKHGRLFLEDTVKPYLTDLSARHANIWDDQASYLGHRALRFAKDGKQALYFRKSAGASSDKAPSSDNLVLLDLETLAEVEVEPGPGLLWRADFDVTSAQVLLQVVEADSNKNQRLDFPYPARNRSQRLCTSPIPQFNVWEFPGDRPVTRVVSIATREVSSAPGFIASHGQGWLARDNNFALFEASAKPGRIPLASAQCNARVVHSDAVRKLSLVACLGAKNGPLLELVGPGYRNKLGLQVSPFETDVELAGRPRLIPIYPKEGPVALLDLETRSVAKLSEKDWVVASLADRALIIRNNAPTWWNAGVTTQLPGLVASIGEIRQVGAMVHVPPLLIDIQAGKVLGQVLKPVFGLSQTGAVLVAANAPATVSELALGPLHWEAPTPLAGSATASK